LQWIITYLQKVKKIHFIIFLDIADSIIHYLSDYKFVDDDNNIIDVIWGSDKPKYKKDPVLILPIEFTGKSCLDKYKEIKDKIEKEMKNKLEEKDKKNFTKKRYLISKLDCLAWTLNLRGQDISYNPLFFSYGLLYFTENDYYFHLFSDKDKFNKPEIESYLKENKITLFDYNEIIPELLKNDENTLTIADKSSTNYKMYNLIFSNKHPNTISLEINIIEHIKCIKNPIEISGYKKSNIRDCVALLKFFSWMEQELITKQRTDLNEYEIGLQSKKFREEQELFMGESFAPICAAGPNAAIIHYSQNENLHSDMSLSQLILCDTGGQYKDGTTDITRTVHFGNAKDKEKEMYTRVLLGNLSLERLIFKKGSTLRNLDSVPRSFLMQVGEDYKHGTSHGVGHFLNVHEGPRGYPLNEGNVITNEPGYYEENSFGIRIENSVLVVDKGDEKLGFENLTYLPYERNLIDLNLLSQDVIEYIDNFHKKVYEILSPFVKDDEKVLDYLKRKTQPLNS
jgi:Xaa-Pro aminopeptidase